jgi:hypothetical protein
MYPFIQDNLKAGLSKVTRVCFVFVALLVISLPPSAVAVAKTKQMKNAEAEYYELWAQGKFEKSIP